MNHRSVLAAQILWPSFLMAAVLEMLLFSVMDPEHVSLGGWTPDQTTVYSLTFLVLWAAMAAASYMSHWIRQHPRAADGRKQRRSRRASASASHAH
jgi:hypothetical protein